MLRRELPPSPAASGAWRALRQQPDVRAGVASAVIDSLTGSVGRGDEAAQLLADVLAPEGVVAVVLFQAAAHDSLRLVGHCGVSGDVVSAWRSIPPSDQIPHVRSLREGRAYFWPDADARAREFPALANARATFEAAATVPILDAGVAVGVVALTWAGPQGTPGHPRWAFLADSRCGPDAPGPS